DEVADDERLRASPAAVGPVDRRGMDLDEDFVLLGDRSLDLFESQDFRWPVPVVDNGSHRGRPPLTVRTTFPVFCFVSTYFVASTTSSSGYDRSMTARYFPASMSSLRKRTS